MSVLPQTIYRFSAIPIKIPMEFFRYRKKKLKILFKQKKTPNSQSKLRKKNKFGGIMLADIKLYYKTIVIKIVWYWLKNGKTDQYNRI